MKYCSLYRSSKNERFRQETGKTKKLNYFQRYKIIIKSGHWFSREKRKCLYYLVLLFVPLFGVSKRIKLEGKRRTKLRSKREPLLQFLFCKRRCSFPGAGKDLRSLLKLVKRTFKNKTVSNFMFQTSLGTIN